MNTLFVDNEKMKLCCVQMMVRFFIENCPEEKTPTGKKAHWVFTQHKESPRKRSVFKVTEKVSFEKELAFSNA